MIKSICISIIALFVLTGMAGEETVPPRAAGLWEIRSTTEAMRFGNKVVLPASTRVSKMCVAAGDPTPEVKRSIEMSNWMALTSCHDKKTTKDGNRYVVEETCNDPKAIFHYRRVYEGDFNRKIIEHLSMQMDGSGTPPLETSMIETRIGNCTPGK